MAGSAGLGVVRQGREHLEKYCESDAYESHIGGVRSTFLGAK